MSLKLRISFAVIAIGASLFAHPIIANAQVNDFTVESFAADYNLSAEDKQGTLKIIEDIDVDFQNFNHGLLRALPDRYKGHSLQLKIKSVTSKSGAPSGYSTYKSNGNTILKIGDKNKVITGKQNYKIEYEFNNVISFYDNQNEFYWNINGTQWQQPFTKVSVVVHLPKELTLTQDYPLCFTGDQGSTESLCTIVYNNEQNDLISQTTQPLSAGQNLSIVAGFKPGYFTPSSGWETFLEWLPSLAKITVPPILIGGYALGRWRKLGRDAKGRGVIVPQYEPPKNMTPVEMGTLVDFSTSSKDVTATIIDLAIRGYIILHEDKKVNKFRKDTLEYSFELANEDISGLKDYESSILSGIFTGGLKKGTVVNVADLKNKFYTTLNSVKTLVKKAVISGGYFKSDPTRAGGRLWGLVILLLGLCLFSGPLFGAALVVGFILSILVVIPFAINMPARTLLGAEALEHARGLKMYITMAEADRIKMLQSPDSPYAANKSEPKRTVKLFEKLLPYAMILGVEKEWAKQFESIYKETPSWYAGNVNTFSTIYLASSLSGTGFGSAMNASFASPSSSGGSGFSGGGFSGGGGGGGGGGGW